MCHQWSKQLVTIKELHVSGHFDKHADFMSMTCTDCVHNGECCVARTCINQDVSCASDLYTQVKDYGSKNCLVCADNALECCEPKVCGHHFLDAGNENECPEDTHKTKARNSPCVNCDRDECCIPLPTLKCAEIFIPHGQAFYSRPNGLGSERTKGSILSVECDLGYKFQDAEYGNCNFFQIWLRKVIKCKRKMFWKTSNYAFYCE